MTPLPTSKDGLEAELEQYRDFEGIDVPAADSEELSNNEKRAAVLTALREEHGTIVTLTQEDIDDNAAFGEEAEAGDAILLTADELETFEAAREAREAREKGPEGEQKPLEGEQDGGAADTRTPEQKADDEATQKAKEDAANQEEHPGAAPAGSGDVTKDVAAEFKPVPGGTELTYMGRTVVSVANRIIGGALYKEVQTPLETFTLSAEEFDRDVKPRA